jgi:hypothetical protein
MTEDNEHAKTIMAARDKLVAQALAYVYFEQAPRAGARRRTY